MNSLHLLEQADRLLEPPAHGAPRQADKRRAVSAAYYAVFHAAARLVADALVGAVHRRSARYVVLYRSVSHGRLKTMCQEILKPVPSAAWRPYWPPHGFAADIQGFATALLTLLQARHSADYDPRFRITTLEAEDLLKEARSAIRRLDAASPAERNLLAALLIASPQS